MRIEWTTFALNIVLEQSEYIAETRGQKAAEAWIEGIFARTEQLYDFPESGRIIPEFTPEIVPKSSSERGAPALREIRYGQYRIIYRIAPKVVYILTVRHTRQLLTEDDIEERT